MGGLFYSDPPVDPKSPAARETRRYAPGRRLPASGREFAPFSVANVEEMARSAKRLNTALDPSRTGRDAAALESGLKQLIVGQDEAVAQIVNIIQMHLTGMCAPLRPVGNLLFLGPTGSGKTRIVEAAAESMVGTSRAVVKVDCGEFQHSHEIAKLIGSPPGYLGHRETHPLLSQEVLNQYHTERCRLSFVLFDEIEKASDALWNLLLGILDKATLTLGDNRKVDFSRAIIFMTSNLGASEMSSLLSPRLGFAAAAKAPEGTELDDKTRSRMARSGVDAARRKFTPEFMNRLDKVVVFNSLGTAELRRILDIELGMVQQRVFSATLDRSFVFQVTGPAKQLLLDEGTDAKYGARHLKRAIERLLVQPLSNLIATEQIRGGDLVRIDFENDLRQLTFVREAEGLPVQVMAQMIEPPARGWVQSAGAAIQEAQRVPAARSRRA